MSIKQDAQVLVKEYFKSNAAKDNCISAANLTDMIATVTERDYSDKTIRARLRREHKRKAEMKNAEWRITATVAQEDLEYYMKRNQAS